MLTGKILPKQSTYSYVVRPAYIHTNSNQLNTPILRLSNFTPGFQSQQHERLSRNITEPLLVLEQDIPDQINSHQKNVGKVNSFNAYIKKGF